MNVRSAINIHRATHPSGRHVHDAADSCPGPVIGSAKVSSNASTYIRSQGFEILSVLLSKMYCGVMLRKSIRVARLNVRYSVRDCIALVGQDFNLPVQSGQVKNLPHELRTENSHRRARPRVRQGIRPAVR